MKNSKILAALSILFLLTIPAASLAASGPSPAKGADTGNNGLKIEGDASGTKLTGVIAISFDTFTCNTDYNYPKGTACTTGNNAAQAKVALRLSRGNLSDDNTRMFYVSLGQVPYKDIASVQTIAIAKLRPQILNQFFGAPLGGDTSQVNIFLKEISFFYDSKLLTEPPDTFADYDFAAIADLVLAVNY